MPKNKTCQEKSSSILEKNTNDEILWNEAITDTEKRLAEEKKKLDASKSLVSKLEQALRTYKGNRERGLAWPRSTKLAATQN